MRLAHLFYRNAAVGCVGIHRLVDGPHAPLTRVVNNHISLVKQRAWGKLSGLVIKGGHVAPRIVYYNSVLIFVPIQISCLLESSLPAGGLAVRKSFGCCGELLC